MQYFDRRQVRPPKFLQSPDLHAERQNLATFFERGYERMAQSDYDGDLLMPLNDASVLDKIRELFHDKCAFCETRTTVHPYRFRPHYQAYPADRSSFPHLYYAWLAYAWENIYAICEDCRPADEGYFPVRGARCRLPEVHDVQDYAEAGQGLWGAYPPKEDALLLDPCLNFQVERQFDVTLSGTLHAKGPKAQTTMQHFSLGRPELERVRGEYFQIYLERAARFDPRDPGYQELFDFKALEFGGLWYLLLRRCVREADALLPIARAKIGKSLARALGVPEKRDRFERALNDLSQIPYRASASRQKEEPPPERRVAPHLLSIDIENFKSIEQLSLRLTPSSNRSADHKSPPALLLLGENATGKSSILEAIALACLSDRAPKDLQLQADGFVLNADWLGGPPERRSREARVRLAFAGGDERVLRVAPGVYDAPSSEALVFAYGAFRRYEDSSGVGDFPRAGHQASLFHSRHALPNPNDWLVELHGRRGSPRFSMVARVLNKLFGIEDDSFSMIRVINGRCYIDLAQDPRAPISAQAPFDAASSGFRSLVGLICDICAGLMDPEINPDFDQLISARAIVLIDEIEAHMHPRWKMQVMSGLRAALPEVTFIVTSHEPLCLRGMDSGEVRVLYRTEAKTQGRLPIGIAVADNLPDFRQMTIEQILTSDFFSLFTTDAIETERKFAEMGDFMSRRDSLRRPLNEAERSALEDFERDVASALPLGANHVQRLIESAIALNLAKRRKISLKDRQTYDRRTVRRIAQILRGI